MMERRENEGRDCPGNDERVARRRAMRLDEDRGRRGMDSEVGMRASVEMRRGKSVLSGRVKVKMRKGWGEVARAHAQGTETQLHSRTHYRRVETQGGQRQARVGLTTGAHKPERLRDHWRPAGP